MTTKEIHANVKQQAIDLMRSSKRNLETSDKEDSSGTGPPCRKSKHPDETWSVILGPMFKKGSEDTCSTSTDDQEVDKEFQKYLQ